MWTSIALSRRADHAGLRQMAVFDAVVNNADRKIGHLLPDRNGHLYGCDHGVCFAEEYKLRTVLWQWRGQRLPDRAVQALRRLQTALDGELCTELSGLLTRDEVDATRQRVGNAARAPGASLPRRTAGRPCPGRRCNPGAASRARSAAVPRAPRQSGPGSGLTRR